MKNKKIILGVSGSIAAYRSADVIRRLKQEEFSVSVIMTKEAEAFISPLTMETLSGNKVYKDMFAPSFTVKHISLSEQADLMLIVPATANIIAKIACGICDDLLTTTVCATSAPVLIAPAMNENMYKNRITQDNIKKLKTLGYKFVAAIRGKLACGKIGDGCLAEVDTIVNQVKNLLGYRNKT